jgi:hypothetical protein
MVIFTALWWHKESYKGCNIGLVTNQLRGIHFSVDDARNDEQYEICFLGGYQ